MDQYNVITPTSDLDELNNDMTNWTMLPYNMRLRSDEECIRRYNMTNIDLYNKIKAAIINHTPLEIDDDIIGSSVSEGFVEDPMFSDQQQLLWKQQFCDQLEQSPNIVIITPNDNKSLQELEEKFLKYSMLTEKNRRFSDQYSINIWGYNVPNMRDIVKKEIIKHDEYFSDISITVEENTQEKFLKLLDDRLSRCIVENDILGLYNLKLDSFEEMDSYSKAIYNDIVKKVDKAIYEKFTEESIAKQVPFFTLSEMREMDIEDEFNKLVEASNYSNLLRNIKEYNEEQIKNIGWNPSAELNETNMNFARGRQCGWLNTHAPTIVNITGLKSNKIVTESSSMMKNIYKEKGLYPIYITLTYKSNGLFSNVIRFIKHSEYTHAGLSLDSDLRHVSTFQFGKEWKGFANDSIQKYVEADKKCLLMVLALFVDKETKNKIDIVLKDFINKQEKSVYGFGNLFKILINKSNDNDPENLYLVCSQFVDTVLKLANINLINKSSNLVIPEDFKELQGHPKVFKVYEGLAKDYNEKKVEDLIYMLFQTTGVSEMKYSEVMEEISKNYIEGYFHKTENEDVNRILEEVQDLLTPENILVEKKAPISINKKGDLVIEVYKSLEDEYQEAHRLLKSYNENNLEGIKHELARLYYVNCAIEKKIKKMTKDDENYKKFIDLRARVLNDFKKYFTIVMEKEPDFNFSEYFQKSEYYNGNVVIDNSILKFTGNLIKKFLKSIGLGK